MRSYYNDLLMQIVYHVCALYVITASVMSYVMHPVTQHQR